MFSLAQVGNTMNRLHFVYDLGITIMWNIC